MTACSVALASSPDLPSMGTPAPSLVVPASQPDDPGAGGNPPTASATALLAFASAPKPSANLAVHAAATAEPRDPGPAASATPTAEDKAEPTLGAFNITPLAGATVVTPNPTAIAPAIVGDDVVNILLIGTDFRAADTTFRTDTLIVASINKSAGTVSLLSIPRDLYVYVPKWGMARINQAFHAAARNDYPGGGPALLEQTLLYNLGIPIHFYASVNFDGFRQIVDTLGGIEVAVNCQVTEYKLKDPTLDETDAGNYELYTQPAGVTEMDGALALWYARARPVGGDFFRGYRQRQVLRALYQQGLRANVVPQIPQLYGDFREVVETDLSLWDIMQFVPLAGHLGDAQIRSLHIGPNQVTGWTTPAGEAVLLPKEGALQALVAEFFAGANANRLQRGLTWIEVINGGAPAGVEPLAAESLMNEGFAVRYGEAPTAAYLETTLIDHTTSAKGSPLKRLQSILHIADANVLAQPDPYSPVQFQVILGSDYNSCPRLDWMDTSGVE
jgi:LCP family protein required for cell wall assembly